MPQDSESSLNELLSQLGPSKSDNEGEIKGAGTPSRGSREAMVGGLVNCLLIPADRDRGRQELRGGSIRGASLQRIASRCQCNVIYVSYGGQATPEACDSTHLTVSLLGRCTCISLLMYYNMQVCNICYRCVLDAAVLHFLVTVAYYPPQY